MRFKSDKVDTLAVHAGRHHCPSTGAIIPPIYQTATYVLPEVGVNKGFDYSRSSNPTRQILEEALAGLEGAKYGVCYASGMSAADAVFRRLSAGEHVIVSKDVYGGVTRICDHIVSRQGIEITYVDSSKVEEVISAIKSNTKLIWLETPTNPMMQFTDLGAVSKVAKEKNITTGIDSTFATPYLLKPLEYGIDIVVHSTTKYLSGHNQLIGGACLTNDKQIFDELKFMQKSLGAIPSPFDCYLNLLGLSTLPLRMDKHSENGMKVAQFLESHSKVERVIYPGLKSHPQYELASKLMKNGFAGMMSFTLKGGYDSGVKLMNSVKLAALAESLGAVETMITHPASMTHASVPRENRISRGLVDGLVRLSVGIENAEDIIFDLKQALDQC